MTYKIMDGSHDLVDDPWAESPYQMPGSEDFFHVASHKTADFSWADFYAWYSPGARMFFWDGQTGCSCNQWEIDGIGDLQNGSREDLLRSFQAWARDDGGGKWYGVDPIAISQEIRDFEIPS